MGKFSDAFWREAGKNTGKTVSNMIFGDSWSTPYRRTGRGYSSAPPARSKRAEAIEATQELERQRAQFEQEQRYALKTEEIIRQCEREYKYISTLQFRGAEHARDCINDIHSSLELTSSKIKTNWLSLFMSIGVIISIFSLLFWSYIEDFYWYNEDTFMIIALYIVVFAMIMVVGLINKSTDNTRVRTPVRKSPNRILKRLETSYFRKYKECFMVAEPTFVDIVAKEHKRYIFNIKQRRVFRTWGALILFWWLYLLVHYCMGLYKHSRDSSVEQKSISKPIEITPHTQITDNSSTTTIEEEILPYDLINLNTGLRLEKRLRLIWRKYQDRIGWHKERRPIFVCDSPSGCILYVGINPSYNQREDDILITATDKKSLYYQSMYLDSGAPMYFKLLEAFTKDVSESTPYAHMNLLYARENNRDSLIKLDHNFIREQLELSYESILMVKPKVIVFFSSYCKDMIFGADRWVNPSSHNLRSDSYILNGTDIPVIFSEDVTVLDMIGLTRLEKQLKKLF